MNLMNYPGQIKKAKIRKNVHLLLQVFRLIAIVEVPGCKFWFIMSD